MEIFKKNKEVIEVAPEVKNKNNFTYVSFKWYSDIISLTNFIHEKEMVNNELMFVKDLNHFVFLLIFKIVL